jgi:hypothetical protein
MKPSLNKRLDRHLDAQIPEPQVHFIWVDAGGLGFAAQRDALIAAGEARVTDQFVHLFWQATGSKAEP